MYKITLISFIFIMVALGYSYEPSIPPKITSESVVIDASDSINYYDKTKNIVLRGNVSVVKGTSKLYSSILSVWFKDENSSQKPDFMEASGGVRIYSNNYNIFGSRFLFDFSKNEGVIVGNPVILNTNTGSLKVKERFEFSQSKGFFTGRGGIEYKRDNVKIVGETLIGKLKKLEGNEFKIETVELFDKVVVSGSSIVASGNYAIYSVESNSITMADKVRIERDGAVSESCGVSINMDTEVLKQIPCPKVGIKNYFKDINIKDRETEVSK